LTDVILHNYPFNDLTADEIGELITSLISQEILEEIDNEIIIGLKGDHIVNNKDFYSVFETEETLKVIAGNKAIGELQPSPQLIPGANVLLAANIWKIVEVDLKLKKIFVVKALDGKPPVFFGTGGEIHKRVREKMLEIIAKKLQFNYLDEEGVNALEELYKLFGIYDFENLSFDRPLVQKETEDEFYTFTSTSINRTLDFLIRLNKVTEVSYIEPNSSFVFKKGIPDYEEYFKVLLKEIDDFEAILLEDIEKNPFNYNFGKWGKYLDLKYKAKLLINNFYDLPGTRDFLTNLRILR